MLFFLVFWNEKAKGENDFDFDWGIYWFFWCPFTVFNIWNMNLLETLWSENKQDSLSKTKFSILFFLVTASLWMVL